MDLGHKLWPQGQMSQKERPSRWAAQSLRCPVLPVVPVWAPHSAVTQLLLQIVAFG